MISNISWQWWYLHSKSCDKVTVSYQVRTNTLTKILKLVLFDELFDHEISLYIAFQMLSSFIITWIWIRLVFQTIVWIPEFVVAFQSSRGDSNLCLSKYQQFSSVVSECQQYSSKCHQTQIRNVGTTQPKSAGFSRIKSIGSTRRYEMASVLCRASLNEVKISTDTRQMKSFTATYEGTTLVFIEFLFSLWTSHVLS